MNKQRPTKAIRDLIAAVPTTSQLPWWEWDIMKNRVIAGPQKVSMLGYDPVDFEGAGYQAYTDLLHPEDYVRAMDAMRRHLNGRATLYETDYRIRRKSGEYTWYMDRGAVLEWDSAGRPLFLRGIVLDLGPELREKAHDDAVIRAIRLVLPNAGGVPVSVCAECGRLRHGTNDWVEVTADFVAGLPAEVSHGLCPDCYEEQMKALNEE
ncbi:MAG: PAS domain-containing protein, partial [Spirochaetaceae bacterium]|nr:PAS domain-containing protein [Spirochaetaceae bacterium]